MTLIKILFAWGPILLGLGFLAPLTVQAMEAAALTPPFGLTPLHIGLALGLTWGLIAKFTGRWI